MAILVVSALIKRRCVLDPPSKHAIRRARAGRASPDEIYRGVELHAGLRIILEIEAPR